MKKVIFMGTPDFAAHILDEMMLADQSTYEIVAVISQPDKKVGRKRELRATAVKEVAQKHGLTIFQPEKIGEIKDELIALEPDVMITAAYGQLVPTSILEIPVYKCINIHGSLLPKYRGGAPVHYALINGEKETGITIMYMEKKLDAGNMLYQKAIEISDSDTLATMFKRLAILGAEMIIEFLPDFFEGNFTEEVQNDAEVTYAYNVKREETKLNWQQDARSIFNHIRGLSPVPSTFTTIGGLDVKVFKASIVESSTNEEPGTIISATDEGILVATSNQLLLLEDLQVSGKRRMSMEDTMNGIGRQVFVKGERFE